MDEDMLQCPICLDFAQDAVESGCCGRIFCLGCITCCHICPYCRHEDVVTRPTLLARRAIAGLPAECTLNCGAKMTRGDLNAHTRVCPNRQYNCPACGFTSNKAEIAKHIAESHSDSLVENMTYLFQPPMSEAANYNFEDPINFTKNDVGREARLGETGKFYCRARACSASGCCDGYCGPTNGCNCASCQKLDIKSRYLPKGWLVNRYGGSCRLGGTGKFYCGRRVLNGRSNGEYCDYYCGPTNGPQCHACSILQRQTRPGYLYGELWRERSGLASNF